MSKKAASIRVFQLAKELGVDSKDVVAKCQAEDIPGIENHMSVVSIGLSATIREWFSETHGSASGTAVETAAAVDVTKARAKARKRTTSKKDAGADEGAGVTAQAVAEPVVAEPPPTEDVQAAPEKPAARTRAAKAVPKVTPEPAEPAPVVVEEAPVIAPAPQKAAASAPAPAPAPTKPTPVTPGPVMNVPSRPAAVAPAGPMLSQPTKTKMAGPKVIRVETPDVIPAPRSRTGPRTTTPPMRGGAAAQQPRNPVVPLEAAISHRLRMIVLSTGASRTSWSVRTG